MGFEGDLTGYTSVKMKIIFAFHHHLSPLQKKKIVLNKRSLYGIDTSAFTNPLPRIMCPLLNIIWILANKLNCICNVQERIKAG